MTLQEPMCPPPITPVRGRFLHLIPDDKFLDTAHDVFEEAAPGAHDYVLIGAPPFRYLRRLIPTCMTLGTALHIRLADTFPSYSAVFVHYLNDAARVLVASAPQTTKFVWLAWGADFYHLIKQREELLLPMTRALVDSKRLRRAAYADRIRRRLARRIKLLRAPHEVMALWGAESMLRGIRANANGEVAFLNRFMAMATPIAEDYESLRTAHPELRIGFMDWNYPIKLQSGRNARSTQTGGDILLGNSATPENNHLDALHVLAGCKLASRKVICPLSYGNKRYGDAVEQYGRKVLGGQFVPLRTYLAPAEYIRIVSNCSVVVMNHVRQQALGNILIALCSDAHVFLNEKSPIRGALAHIGVPTQLVGAIPAFLQSTSATESQSTPGIAERIEARFGHAAILRRTHDMLAKLH